MNYYIKLIIFLILKNILKVLWVSEIKNNRIIAYSYAGKQYSCNPKYIVEYLLQKNNKLEIIFAVDNIKNFLFLKNKNIKLVKYKSIKFFFYALTSQVFINNILPPAYIPFRKNQFILSTWHGGGAYKKGGLNVITDYPLRVLYKLSSGCLNGMISSSEKFTQISIDAFSISKDLFLNFGMPRNDIFFYENTKNDAAVKVKKRFNIKDKDLIILYAPTWRDDNREIITDIIIKKVIRSFEKSVKKKVKLFIRAHHNTKDFIGSNNYINVTNYPDMQELLCAADILITDYSSCMWDFSLMYKPCFIYAPDIEQYKQDRDFSTPMSDWPFPVAMNANELINNILNFNEKEYVDKVKHYHNTLGSYEDGHACERVYNLIENIMNGKVQK